MHSCQRVAFTAAQAVGAVEDTACLPTPRTTEPCAPPAKPRRGETELNEQRAKLTLTITFDEQHAARLGDDPEFVDPVGCVPRDRRDFTVASSPVMAATFQAMAQQNIAALEARASNIQCTTAFSNDPPTTPSPANSRSINASLVASNTRVARKSSALTHATSDMMAHGLGHWRPVCTRMGRWVFFISRYS